jgi:predicted small lipoprotein YifL
MRIMLSNTILTITLLLIFLSLAACGATATPPPLAVTDKTTMVFIYTNP